MPGPTGKSRKFRHWTQWRSAYLDTGDIRFAALALGLNPETQWALDACKKFFEQQEIGIGLAFKPTSANTKALKKADAERLEKIADLLAAPSQTTLHQAAKTVTGDSDDDSPNVRRLERLWKKEEYEIPGPDGSIEAGHDRLERAWERRLVKSGRLIASTKSEK